LFFKQEKQKENVIKKRKCNKKEPAFQPECFSRLPAIF
jgi:hypothetical protein